MPLMDRDQFEGLLNELLNSELEHSRRTEILQELRVAQSNAYSEYDEFNKKVEKLSKDNSDLVLSNSKLFRQLGNTEPEQKEKEVQKEFSETVTIEQLEKGI
jgi:regulator of replication initiation timing